jgi:hypothetical protein
MLRTPIILDLTNHRLLSVRKLAEPVRCWRESF